MPPSDQPPLDVVIQGAGIGGLTLAIALQQRGHTVTVIERCQALSEIGAGIWMAPNPLQIFQRLGIAGKIANAGWPVRLVRLQDYRGFDLTVTDMAAIAREFGFDTVALHRAALQRLLFEQLKSGTVRFGNEVKEIRDESGSPIVVTLSNGQDLHAQIIVGADGINSAIRSLIGLGGQKRYSGSSSYRGVARLTQPLLTNNSYEAVEIWGKGCRLGLFHINAHDCYWFMTFDAPPNETSTPAEMHAHAASLFRDYFPRWMALLENTSADEMIRTDISDLRPLPKWSAKRVGVIGDAAHATTPNLGQGGAMAVEDAFALTEALHANGFNETAWRQFERKRRAKVEHTVNTSRAIGRICHLRNPVAVGLRNMIVRCVPKSARIAQFRKLFTVN